MIPIAAKYTATVDKKPEEVTIVAVLVSSGESYPIIIFIGADRELKSSMHLGRFTECRLEPVTIYGV